ncbi:hypothetical protein PanWU01x14_172670 [Parasponia andersonii]|uniref:Uncharacterized protein n=1 Tax=Parasponia andersonii TaxID=3476 RepID=A0A2P5C932_PARAD|nr:hypothetical protein PanWU01x14_172670 [Parasponia andersonii]
MKINLVNISQLCQDLRDAITTLCKLVYKISIKREKAKSVEENEIVEGKEMVKFVKEDNFVKEQVFESNEKDNSTIFEIIVTFPPCDPSPHKFLIPKVSLGSNAHSFNFLSNISIGLIFNEIDMSTYRGIPRPPVFSPMFVMQRNWFNYVVYKSYIFFKNQDFQLKSFLWFRLLLHGLPEF